MDFEIFRPELQGAIHAGGLPNEFSLEVLFGAAWPEMPDGVRVNELGTWFKQHVRGSDSFVGEQPFDGIVFSRKTSNNLSLYRLAAA